MNRWRNRRSRELVPLYLALFDSALVLGLSVVRSPGLCVVFFCKMDGMLSRFAWTSFSLVLQYA